MLNISSRLQAGPPTGGTRIQTPFTAFDLLAQEYRCRIFSLYLMYSDGNLTQLWHNIVYSEISKT